MRKIITFILLTFSITCQAQFGWGNLTNTQWISYQDAKGSGIFLLDSLPPGTNWMTKQAAIHYFDIDTSYLTSLTNNQFITKPQTISKTYTSPNIVYWQISFSGGCYGSITIKKNGEQIVYAYTDGASGSFQVNDGDVISTHIYTSGSPNGSSTTLDVFGDRILSDILDASGTGATADETFRWRPVYGFMSIYGLFKGSVITYGNQEQTVVAYKNNCGSGYTGSAVTYTQPANTFYSFNSVAEANTKAYMNAVYNAQIYANQYGTCTPNSSSPNPGCTNNLTISYNPSVAQDFGDNETYMGYVSINGYVMTENSTHTITVHDGDSIILKIHMPPSTKGITGVSINYKDDSYNQLLDGAKIVAEAATPELVRFFEEMFLNLIGSDLSKGTTTNISEVASDPYDIYIRKKYKCSFGNIIYTVNNKITVTQ